MIKLKNRSRMVSQPCWNSDLEAKGRLNRKTTLTDSRYTGKLSLQEISYPWVKMCTPHLVQMAAKSSGWIPSSTNECRCSEISPLRRPVLLTYNFTTTACTYSNREWHTSEIHAVSSKLNIISIHP
jgi:hypothetical protein